MNERDPTPKIRMPIKVKAYQHQIEAFNFVCKCFGLVGGGGTGDANDRSNLPGLRESI